MLSLQIPKHIWIEMYDSERDACDVIVQMEEGTIYTAVFVTLPFLRRQMELSFEVCKQLPDAQPVRFAALETPHLVVDNLDRDTIEDTIDNLLTLENFEAMFTQVTEAPPTTDTQQTPIASLEKTALPASNGTRATQEIAAVVISDVLVVEGD
ncbi:MAG: hypothetical protein HXY40_05900 [Chloroflexi bacterium]|nr:hypothetical protein [Chloroflexota bacterium]